MIRQLLALAIALPLSAQTWNIVVSKSCCENCRGQVRLIYLKKQQYIGECKANPVSLPFDSAARTEFMGEVLDMELSEWERYWSTMHFKGIDTPLVLQSPNAIAMFVKKIPGTVGCIPEEMVDDSMTVLHTFKP